MLQLFDAFVGSILNFSCEVWGNSKTKSIERLHLNFCKKVLLVKRSTSSMAVYGETGRFPLFVNRYARIIKYWLKLINTENIILKTMYDILVSDYDKGRENWVSGVKYLLDEYGFSYVWLNPSSVNINTFPSNFKKRVVDCFIQKWHGDVGNCSRCSVFVYAL